LVRRWRDRYKPRGGYELIHEKSRFLKKILISSHVGYAIASQAHAAKQIAKVSNFSGDVVIKSDARFTKISRVGQPLNARDFIQTRDGQVDVVFEDGAVMKVRPYTNASVSEKDEEPGFLIKSKKAVRRITCFVGELRFKSGGSNRKNYLQMLRMMRQMLRKTH